MRLNVEAISEIFSFFAKSKNVSYMNGRTHFLLRRPLEIQKEGYMILECIKMKRLKMRLNYIKRRSAADKGDVENYQATNNVLLQVKAKLCKFYEYGVIDSDEELIEDK